MDKLYTVYRTDIGGFANEKSLEEQPKEVLLSLIYSLYAQLDQARTEKLAIIETTDKTLRDEMAFPEKY